MKFLTILIFAIFVSSCAHHHKDSKHHHHEKSIENQVAFKKQCAYSVSQNEYHTKGNEHFKLEHHGVVYYFSNKQNMYKFSNDLKKNIAKANKSWSTRLTR
ncbi:MAG: YHS domain-containing protein [Bacteriovoracaceae bacterium]|jgi:YHS domain-containing protein